jgi:hypothetical protein
MGRPHLDPPLSRRIDPTARDAPARERQRVFTVSIEDGKFKVAFEGGGRNRLPHTLT